MVEDFRELSMLYGSLSFVPVLSQQAQAGRRSDQVGAGADEDFNDRDGWKTHLAGPPAMIDATAPLLIRRGVRAADIHAER
jgi:NAD(P)H-flavin reductase